MSNTILSSLAALFTFLLSVLLLGERFTVTKIGGVMLCILGTLHPEPCVFESKEGRIV